VPADAKTAVEAAGKQLNDVRRRLGVAVPGQGGGPGGGGGGGGGGGANQNVRGTIGQTKGQIMNSHSLPSAQQTRALTQGREDLTKVIVDVNGLIATMPALFDKVGAGALKPAAVKPLRPIGTN